MTRIEYTDDSLLEHGDSLVHRLVIPRPIAWVSTRSRAGVDNVAPHSFFKVEGSDLRIDLPVTLYEAVLGGKVRVPTLGNAVELVPTVSTPPCR